MLEKLGIHIGSWLIGLGSGISLVFLVAFVYAYCDIIVQHSDVISAFVSGFFLMYLISKIDWDFYKQLIE